MPFPLIKVAYLGVRQISKPLANVLKRNAKEYPFLRNKILIPSAQCKFLCVKLLLSPLKVDSSPMGI